MPETTSEFEEFVRRRDAWIRCLVSNDPNSIMNQIHTMIWRAAAFRVVNEARRLAPPDPDGGVQLNGMVHSLIDECFFETQLMALRRLVDGSGLVGERGVYSLTGLIDDLVKHRSLLTRGHALKAERLAYDFQSAEMAEHECRQQKDRGTTQHRTPPELDPISSINRHVEWDELSEVKKTERSPQDVVSARILLHLRKRLIEACEPAKVHVDKFVAHAATPESRERVTLTDVSLGRLWHAHQIICQTANFIDMSLLRGTSHGFVAMSRGDQFVYIEAPLVRAEHVQLLRQQWSRYESETEAWSRFGPSDLLNELSA